MIGIIDLEICNLKSIQSAVLNLGYDLKEIGLVTFKALFYYPDGEFEIINTISIYRDNAKTKIDDEFAKKVETDSLTKALSKLGFNADVFMGRFDDVRYVEEVKKEFSTPKKTIGINDLDKIKKTIESSVDKLKCLEKYKNSDKINFTKEALEELELFISL